MYHEASGMVLLAVTVQETPTLLVFEFLQRLIDIFVEYFGEFDETIIKDNFSTVYQILEEMMDFGYPLTTEPNALKAMIEPPTLISRLTSVTIGYKSGVSDTLPSATISNMPWRKADVKYAANEIYLDIIEEVDAIIDKHGQLVSFDVTGSIMGNSRLSGVPDLTLQFVDPSVIDDCSFHPCVRYNRYERDHAVSFVPPDGQFELMRYRPVLQVPGTGGPGGTKGSSKDMSSYGGASRMVGFGSSSAPSTAPSQQQSSSSAGFQFIPPLFCQPQVSMGTSSMSSISSSSSASFDASLTGHISVTIGTRPDSTLIFPNRTRGGSVVVSRPALKIGCCGSITIEKKWLESR
jgi:AP-3 complex subunit mu